jgi:putative hydrolase of the HAD superfamily
VNIRFVYFDAAGTLLRPEPGVGILYARACRPHGLEVAPERFEGAFRGVWGRREQAGGDGLLLADEDANRAWWRGLMDEILDELGFTGDREACFAACHETFSRPSSWHVFDDVRPTLLALRQQGIPLGVLSNWDGRLVPLLRALGLAPYFGPLVISALEGRRKPDPLFFARACQRAGVPAAQILHVGDQRRLDLIPARNAGMQALLVDRSAAAGAGDVISTLQAIPALVARKR